MDITLAAFKGGVGKTTSAIHLSAFMAQQGSTLLIDGDPNRSASSWASRGDLPFTVMDEKRAMKHIRRYEHVVFDTAARPTQEDLKALAEGCDLLIIPTTPDALSLDALLLTVESLQAIGNDNYRILLTMVPPKPNRDGEKAYRDLSEAGLPLFEHTIRRLVAFQRAALDGSLVSGSNDIRAQEGWRDYERVGREVLV